MSTSPHERDRESNRGVTEEEVDRAAAQGFGDLLVSKARARRFASGHSIPHHLAESLLSNFRAKGNSGPDAASQAREFLSDHLAKAENIELLKMEASRNGSIRVVDRIEGQFDSMQDRAGVSFSRLGLTNVPVSDDVVDEHPRLLKHGFYACVRLDYEGDKSSGSPFHVQDLEPLAPTAKDIVSTLEGGRKSFSDAAWLYFLVRSVGFAAPSERVSPRTAALILMRLVPLTQKRYGLLELGPRQTGKSYLYDDLTPHAYVLPSGRATEAQLFVHAGTGEAGLVAEYDAVSIDEVTTTGAAIGDIASGLRGYLSSGASRRGKEEVRGSASIVFIGNVDRPVEEILEKEGHLFAPLPDVVQDDTALMDRISAYVPGWEMPKLGPEYYASGLALPSDVLAECLKKLRERKYTPEIRHRLTLEGNLTGRDQRAVLQTISGLVKLIHPTSDDLSPGSISDKVLRWAAWLGLEMRLRIRAQQHRLQPEEFEEGEFGFRVGGGKAVAVTLPETV